MRIFAIADTHLSFARPKPMEVFGEHWRDHHEQIARAWRAAVGPDDAVLLPGDISWAVRLDDALPDLAFLDQLPGQKVLVRGNHDYWWHSIGRVRRALPASIRVLHNDALAIGGVVVAGARGWTCPGDAYFAEADQAVYEREVERLRLSLEAAAALTLGGGGQPIWAMLHFPTTNERHEHSGFLELLERFGVQKVIYGHLHGEESHRTALLGMRGGIEYHLAAADYLNFAPLLLGPPWSE